MYVFDIIVTFFESIFLLIPLINIKKIKSKKKILLLVFGIFISIILSSILFKKSIFKYLLMPSLIFTTLKSLEKNTCYYDFFIIVLELLLKIIIEFICYLIFFNLVNYIWFVIIMETICLIIILLLNKFIPKIYNVTFKKWKGRKRFYFRYILLILFNSFIFFLIYNLLLIREVL